MTFHTLGHALQTLFGILSLWLVPWAVILTAAAVITLMDSRLTRNEAPPVHLPKRMD